MKQESFRFRRVWEFVLPSGIGYRVEETAPISRRAAERLLAQHLHDTGVLPNNGGWLPYGTRLLARRCKQ